MYPYNDRWSVISGISNHTFDKKVLQLMYKEKKLASLLHVLRRYSSQNIVITNIPQTIDTNSKLRIKSYFQKKVDRMVSMVSELLQMRTKEIDQYFDKPIVLNPLLL